MEAVPATFYCAYAFSRANQRGKGGYLPGGSVAGERLGTVSCAVRTRQQQERQSVPGQGGARAYRWELPLAEGWMAEAGRQPGRGLALEGLTAVPTCPPPAAGVLGEYYHGTSEGKRAFS